MQFKSLIRSLPDHPCQEGRERGSMSIFSRRIPFDRKALLEQAERLQTGRRWRHALTLYRQVLAAEPRNAELHFRTAPLLARAGRSAEAWESFAIAAETLDQKGDEAQRLRLLRKAASVLPRHFEAHRSLARAERAQGNHEAALIALQACASRLSRRATRSQAVLLLRDACQMAPGSPPVLLDLAQCLGRDGQAAEALFLLDQLETRAKGADLLRTRRLAWRIEPSLRHSWRYFVAWRQNRGSDLRSSGHGPKTAGVRARA